MIMFVVVILVLISGYLYSRAYAGSLNQDRVRRNYIIFVSIILILQSALRNLAVGADTYAYYLIFEDIKNWGWSDIWNKFREVYVEKAGKDAGYTLLQKTFQIFSGSYHVFLFAIAAFFFYAFGKVVYNNTEKISNVVFAYILYLSLFYSFFSITGLRQTIATSILLLGLTHIRNKKPVLFLLYCMLAFFVHKSAAIFILIYPLYWNRKTKLLYSLGLLVLPAVFALRKRIINYTYLLYYDEFRDGGLAEIPWTFIIFMIICYIFIFININNLRKTENTTILRFCNVVLFGIILSPTIGADSGTMRIVQYFSLFLVFILPAIFDLYQHQLRQIIYTGGILLLLLILLRRSNEYAFYWQPMKLGGNYGFEKIIQE